MASDLPMAKILLDGMIFPPMVYWPILTLSREIWIDAASHYVKRTFRNRYYILNSQGLHRLSVPLKKGKNNRLPIKDVKIDYQQKWQTNHLRSLRSAYGKSPYFIHLIDLLEERIQTQVNTLLELQVRALQLVLDIIQLPSRIYFQNDYATSAGPDMFDARNFHKIFGSDDLHFFKPYHRGHRNQDVCVAKTSILDALFYLGPYSIDYLAENRDMFLQKFHTKLQQKLTVR